MAQLVCRVGESAMVHERALYFQAVDGECETWADREAITLTEGDERLPENQAPGLIEVRVVRQDDSGRVLVELPRDVVMRGRRVWVPSASLDS